MKAIIRKHLLPHKLNFLLARALLVAGFLLGGSRGLAQLEPPGTNYPSYTPLNAWLFDDNTNWTSFNGRFPVSFTNLAWSYLGDGSSLVVDTNLPAWLQFNVIETNGATNLTVDCGTVTFWFAPSSWSSTNAGGVGPGEYGRLLEVGAYTPDSSFGWWSLYVDPAGANLYFSAQTNDASSNVTTYLSAPISWTTNYFHFVALTYSATNTALYLDGVLATNGPPMTVYPGPLALANGFFIGSDSNGIYQAHGLFNLLETYNVPLDTNTIQDIFEEDYGWYMMDPLNTAMVDIMSAPSTPSTLPTPDVITGAGDLLDLGSAATCASSTTNVVWLTNITASVASDDTMNVTFAIEGGVDGVTYDVFANSVLSFGTNGVPWAWMGQGQHCEVYSLSGLPNTACFLILGTPVDSDGDGLTDAYESLVSKTDPNNAYSNLDGILDGWEILLGLNPQISNFTSPNQRSNYGYTGADWLNSLSGVRSGTIITDNEGNVQTVSQ